MPRKISDPWGPNVVERRSCPFRPCRAVVDVVQHAPASDRPDEVVNTIVQHRIEGPESWYQVLCPASHLLIPFSEKGLEVLRDDLARWKAEKARRAEERERHPAADLSAENEDIERRKRAGTLGHLDRPADEYFPPRPGDTEEAQAELGTGPNTNPDIETIPVGGRDMTSSNETTISMLQLAKQNLSAVLEDAVVATSTIGTADARITDIDERLTAALQLLAGAVAASASAPALANEASSAMAQAGVRAAGAGAQLVEAVEMIGEALASAGNANDLIDRLIAQLSA